MNRRRFFAATGGWLVMAPAAARAQSGAFTDADDAARALFPEAGEMSKRAVATSGALQGQIARELGKPPSLWEERYPIYVLARGGQRLGWVVVVEEIGKHRPITFAVGVDPDGTVRDLSVLAY